MLNEGRSRYSPTPTSCVQRMARSNLICRRGEKSIFRGHPRTLISPEDTQGIIPVGRPAKSAERSHSAKIMRQFGVYDPWK